MSYLSLRPGFSKATVSVLGVLLCVLSAVPCTAGLASGSGSPLAGPTEWAYGANRTATEGGLVGNGTYSVSTSFGYHVLMTQSSQNSSSISLTASRTAAETFQFQLCVPGCRAPMFSASLSARAWEIATVSANFTNAGSVLVNGSAVAALALENTRSVVQSNLTENWSVVGHGPAGGVRNSMASLSIGASTSVSTAFSPALGLVPANVTPGDSWQSRSQASSSGSWSVSYLLANTSITGTGNRVSGHPTGSAAGAQSIVLAGRDTAKVLLAGSIGAEVIELNLTGSFHTREGFIFLPGESDLFGVSHGPWEPLEAGQAGASTQSMDYLPHSISHLGVFASSTTFGGATTATVPSTAMGPLASPATGSGGVIQAEPETFAQGQTGSQCLLSACGPSSSSPVPEAPRGPWIVVGLAAGATAVLAAVVTVDRRRRIPEPPRSPSSRYTRATIPTERPPTAPRAPGVRAPEPPDPLENLW
jgi:hypothetical protein